MSLRPLDLAVFALYMLMLIGMGVYFTRQQKGLKSYLLADQNIHWIIVAVSVLAALFSGITYLGAPADVLHDLSYIWVVSFFIATPITTLVFLPFFAAHLYTAYEYLERRFDRRLRWLASGLFIPRVSCYLALAVYAPSLAIVEITGWPLEIGAADGPGGDGLHHAGRHEGRHLDRLAAVPGAVRRDRADPRLRHCRGSGRNPRRLAACGAKGRTRFINLDLNPTVR